MKKLIVLALVMGLAGVASAQITIEVIGDGLVITVEEGKVYAWALGCIGEDDFWSENMGEAFDVDWGYREDSLIDYASEPGAPGTIPLSAIPEGTEQISIATNGPTEVFECITLADYGIGGDGDGDVEPPPALLVTASAAVIEEGDDITLAAAEVEGAVAYDWFYAATIGDPAAPIGDPGMELLIEGITAGDEGIYMCRVNTGETEMIEEPEGVFTATPIYVRGYIVLSGIAAAGEVPAVGIIGLGLLIGAGVIGGALRSRKLLVLALVLGLAGVASAELTVEVEDGTILLFDDEGGSVWGYGLTCADVQTFDDLAALPGGYNHAGNSEGVSGYEPGGYNTVVSLDMAVLPEGTEEITVGVHDNPWTGDTFYCVVLAELEEGGGDGDEEEEAPPINMLTASAEFIVTGGEFTLTAPLVEDLELGVDDYGYPGFVPDGMVVYTWFPPVTAPADSDDDDTDNVYTVADAQSAELVGMWKVEYSSGDNIGDAVDEDAELVAAYYTILDTQFIASEEDLPAVSVIGLGLLVGAGAICGALRARKR